MVFGDRHRWVCAAMALKALPDRSMRGLPTGAGDGPMDGVGRCILPLPGLQLQAGRHPRAREATLVFEQRSLAAAHKTQSINAGLPCIAHSQRGAMCSGAGRVYVAVCLHCELRCVTPCELRCVTPASHTHPSRITPAPQPHPSRISAASHPHHSRIPLASHQHPSASQPQPSYRIPTAHPTRIPPAFHPPHATHTPPASHPHPTRIPPASHPYLTRIPPALQPHPACIPPAPHPHSSRIPPALHPHPTCIPAAVSHPHPIGIPPAYHARNQRNHYV